jgi:hypothetical protein
MSGTTRHLYGSTLLLHFKLVTWVLTLPLQTASGRHWLATCALHLLTGAAVESANPWRRSNLFMKNVVKEMNLYGVISFKIRLNCICWQSKIMELFNCGYWEGGMQSWDVEGSPHRYCTVHQILNIYLLQLLNDAHLKSAGARPLEWIFL